MRKQVHESGPLDAVCLGPFLDSLDLAEPAGTDRVGDELPRDEHEYGRRRNPETGREEEARSLNNVPVTSSGWRRTI